MKHVSIFSLLLLLAFACTNEPTSQEPQPASLKQVEELQTILDNANLTGSILLFDADSNRFYSNNFEWANQGHLPASTFKIPNSIIALETGVVENDSTLFPWDGNPRRLKSWEQDLIFRDAFQKSCVPCYQEVARKIGYTNMRQYLDTFRYGNILFDSSTIDTFWLTGKSTITQFQQIDFLYAFFHQHLPVSSRTAQIMRRIMLIEEGANYTLSGKTGWSQPDGGNNGWFVGRLKKGNREIFFATNVEPKANASSKGFGKARIEVTHAALRWLAD